MSDEVYSQNTSAQKAALNQTDRLLTSWNITQTWKSKYRCRGHFSKCFHKVDSLCSRTGNSHLFNYGRHMTIVLKNQEHEDLMGTHDIPTGLNNLSLICQEVNCSKNCWCTQQVSLLH